MVVVPKIAVTARIDQDNWYVKWQLRHTIYWCQYLYDKQDAMECFRDFPHMKVVVQGLNKQMQWSLGMRYNRVGVVQEG